MTVLSRSKNAAARVTRHDSKWTASAAAACARRPHPIGSSTVRRRFWHCLPTVRVGSGVSARRPPSARPLVVSADEELLDDLLRLLPPPVAEPELATGGPALRRAHRDAPLVLVGADALSGARSAPCPAGPAWSWWPRASSRGRVGRGRGDRGRARGGAARRRVVAAGPVGRGRAVTGGARLAGRRRRQLRGRGRQHGRDRGGPGRRARRRARRRRSVGRGLDLLLGAERVDGLRWPELTGLRGRVGGDALLAALPEVDGVHVLAASRSSRGPARTRR